MSEVEVGIGARIQKRRRELGLTQTELAEAIDVRFQQVQKYEKGQNRVAASRLWRVAQALKVPVAYFFTQVDDDGAADTSDVPEHQIREYLSLLNSLKPEQRAAVMSFLRAIAE